MISLCATAVLAQDSETLFSLEQRPTDLRFIENKGQWTDQLEYLAKFVGGTALYEKGKIIYDFYELPLEDHHLKHIVNHDHNSKEVIMHHAVFVHFDGANPNPSISHEWKYPEYHNYFIGKDRSKWKGHVNLFGQIGYEDLYDGIDMRVYGEGDVMKYDFLVAAGADPSKIQLRYEGTSFMELNEGVLHLTTSLGEIWEKKPIAFQMVGGEKKEVTVRFVLEDKTLSYEFPNGYDTSKELLIDPVLVFASHSGSTSDNWGFTATYDSLGNAYGGGIALGTTVGGTNYPATPGAYDTQANGSTDIGLSKFSDDGSSLLYATYLGGSMTDFPHSLIVNNLNQLIVFGYTTSSDFPTSTGAFDNTIGGTSDIYIARFSEDGSTLIASTYVGGSDIDGQNTTGLAFNYGDASRGEVIVDANDNILVGSITASTDFPTTTPTMQGAYNGGASDGVIFQLTPDLSTMTWATYFGGSSADAVYSLKKADTGEIFAVGGTSSLDLDVTGPAVQTTYQGGNYDGFIIRMPSTATALLSATYLGTADDDQAYLLDLDNAGDVYVTGQSIGGTWPVVAPTSGPMYSNAGAEQFIIKMPSSMNSILWSTTIGTGATGQSVLSPTAFQVDECGRIYVAGWGDTDSLEITLDAIQSTTDGDDFYLAVYEENMTGLAFGTYFGGSQEWEHVDGGTARFDKRGVVYQAVCASCGGSGTFPGTPGAYSPTTGVGGLFGGCNLAVFKINLETFNINADFNIIDSMGTPLANAGCAPLSVEFLNLTTNTPTISGYAYTWEFGIPGQTSTDFQPTYTYNTAGVYQVRLIVEDTVGCRLPDTVIQQVTVFPNPTVDAGLDTAICVGDTILLSGNSSSAGIYRWTPSAAIINPDTALQNVPITTTINQTYIVRLIDNNGCQAIDSVTVSVEPTGTFSTYSDTVGCYGGDFQLNVDAPWASTIIWTSSNPAVGLNDPSLANPIIPNLLQPTILTVEMANSIGCTETASFELTVSGDSIFQDTSICEGESVQLSLAPAVVYRWSPFQTLDDPESATPIASPLDSTLYTVTATTAEGCEVYGEWFVEVFPTPVVDAGVDSSFCIGDGITLLASGNGTPSWSPALGLDNPDIYQPFANPTASQTYQLVVESGFGCADSDQVSILVNNLPNVDAGTGATICDGDSLTLSASGAFSYQWDVSTDLVSLDQASTVAIPVSGPVTYFVTGTDINGCVNRDSVTVELIDIPLTTLVYDHDCETSGFNLFASGGSDYVWNTGDTGPNQFYAPTDTTTYTVRAVNGACEGQEESVTLDPNPLNPLSAFEVDVNEGFAPYEVQTTNLSQNYESLVWINPFTANRYDENPLFSIPIRGTHEIKLIVTSSLGCIDSSSVFVSASLVAIDVPSAFSPNLDGYNDDFFIKSVGMESLQVSIFNRWGQRVFQSDELDFQWDGNGPRGPVVEGVYVYKIEAVGRNGNIYERVGTVTVIR